MADLSVEQPPATWSAVPVRPHEAAVAKLSVVIPCLDEQRGIGSVLDALLSLEYAQDYCIRLVEVIVVDNGSTDATAALASGLGATVVHEPRRGKGHALRAGIRSVSADSDYVAFLDGDGSYDPADVAVLTDLLHAGTHDVLLGSRLHGGISPQSMSGLRRTGNLVLGCAFRTLYCAHIPDVLCGISVWRASALNSLLHNVHSEGFEIDAELVIKSLRAGFMVSFLPVCYRPRYGRSHLRPFRDGLRIALTMVNLKG
jgi:glycosyltransferase involved in cell wall biosynthesis